MSAPSSADEAVSGLDDAQRKQRAADFFDRFAWDGRALDPKTMSATEFLDALLTEAPGGRGASS